MIFSFIRQCVEHMVTRGPSNKLFSRLRCKYYHHKLMPGSRKFSSMTGLAIPCPEKVFIGSHVTMNEHVIINACNGGEIHIGEDCLIGPFTVMRAADHIFDDPGTPIRLQGHKGGKIVLEGDVWIGAHVTITRNVTIGKGSVIGDNSVVTHDIPPYSVAVGRPAEVIKKR